MNKEVVTTEGTQLNINTYDIFILLVDDDFTSLTVIGGILKRWKYNVETVRNGGEALSALRSNKDKKFDLVVTDVLTSDTSRFELLKHISTEFQIPIVMISADDNEHTMVKGLEYGAVYFMRKPVNPEELKNVWQYAIPKRNQEPSSQIAIEDTNALGSQGSISEQDAGLAHVAQTISQGPAVPAEEEKEEEEVMHSTVDAPDKCYEKLRPKRKLTHSKQKIKKTREAHNNNPGAALAKKRKVAWSTDLHNKFLDALKIIGLDRAVPKKILEVMHVPGLTRENVASHLQKYRLFLKRVADVAEKPDGIGSRNHRSNFSSSCLPLYYGFQLEHLDITDDNLLRKKLKQELRALRDPLYMGPSWRHLGPSKLSNNSGSSSTHFSSNYSSTFAQELKDYSPNKEMTIGFGERLIGVGGMRGTDQMAFPTSNEEIMRQAAPSTNNIDMTNNASGNKGFFIMDDNTTINCQPSGLVQYGMNMTTGTELHTGGLVNSSGPQGSISVETFYGMETYNSRMMSQAAFGNPTVQYQENAPTRPMEVPNVVNDAGESYMYNMTNIMDTSGFQADFSDFLVDQPDDGEQTIDALVHAGTDIGNNPYFDFSGYAADAQQNNQESVSVLNQQFDEGSNPTHTGNGDAPYWVDEFYPWFDQEPTHNQVPLQPENQNTNVPIADELMGIYQGFNQAAAGNASQE